VKTLTVARAVAWIGVALVGWSLNIRWGDDIFLGNGPPATYHKNIVGALLLAFGAALAISVSRAWPAKGLGIVAAVGCAAIALTVRTGAPATVTSGAGWIWMAAGASSVLLGAVAAIAVRAPAAKKSRGKR